MIQHVYIHVQQTVLVHNRKFTTTEQQEVHNRRDNREAAEREIPQLSASLQKKRHQVLISFSHFWPEHYIITSRI